MRKLHRQKNRAGTVGKKTFDRGLLVLTVILFVVGLIAVADASAPMAASYFSDSFYFIKQQIVWGGLGFAALFLGMIVHYSLWRRLSVPIFFGSIALLILVLIPGIGSKLLGARRWISLGPIGLQPAEFVKLSLAIFLASLAEAKKPYKFMIFCIALVAVLIMLEPDLGTTIIIGVIGLIQVFIAGIPIIYLLGTGGLAGISGFLLIMLSDYRRQRLWTYLKSSSDPLGSSYHIRQVLIALGSGGLFGVGLGHGKQKYLFLPETATDSVFAVISEEIGFVGSAILVVVLTFFVYKIIKIAMRAPDRFSTVLAGGIAAWIGGQIFLNIASMTALVPLTGVPLPFFSYGGSSLVMILFAIGILLNISKYQVYGKR